MLLVIGIKKVGPSARQYFNNAIRKLLSKLNKQKLLDGGKDKYE